jgi:ferritin
MTPNEVIAKIALELKYDLEQDTRDKIAKLYEGATGKRSAKRTNLLKWFHENYEFDGTDTWYHKTRVLAH